MTSHIVFDNSYVDDAWDWFESILIVMDQELWYDPTLGHSHLKELLSGMQSFCLIHCIKAHSFLDWGLILRWPLHKGMPLSVDDGFLRHSRS